MLPFFNQKSSIRASVQVANVLAMAFIIHDYINNPESTIAEHGFEAVALALSYFSNSENGSVITECLSYLCSAARMGAVYAGITSSSSGMTLLYNAISGLVIHPASIVAGFSTYEPDSPS